MAEKSTSRFLHSIDKYAKKKKLKLAEEIKQIEAERLKKEEVKIVENARLLMMSELANVKNEIAMRVYKVKVDSEQKIFNLKSEIQKEVFDDCELRIKEFVESPEYGDYIEHAVEKAENLLGNNLSIFLRKKDIGILRLVSDSILRHDVVASDKIKKGGALFLKDDCVLDCTFDTCILEQKKMVSQKLYLQVGIRRCYYEWRSNIWYKWSRNYC